MRDVRESEEVKKRSKGKEGRNRKRYGVEFKLRCVKLRLEEGIPFSLLAKEAGASTDAIRRWTKAYQKKGEAGLQSDSAPVRSRRKLPKPVREKIIQIKKREPLFGVKRISHLLKRVFFLSASPETVRQTLREESLIVPSRKKHRPNITRPRFFERSTPNQLWQSDIFTFRLGGRYAYLIGFIDDYSRYVMGLELYRTQTADQVLEVYRRAIGEYGVPKEMLTDQGRQYTSWRGSTRFARELVKDRVKHIKSQAHHPMTLGKIERFWKTIYEEFLVRAQFGSFEEARERIRHWMQYYNHKRPHQGIGGLCPADRYFEIQAELRKTIEHGIADNALEMALRGKPREPFYMVGRIEGQSVVLRAEKGKLRLMVDDEESGGKQEMVYEVSAKGGEKDRSIEREGSDGKGGEAGDRVQEKAEGHRISYGRGEVPGGAVGMDGEAHTGGGLPGAGDSLELVQPLAAEGNGGDAPGAGASVPSGPCGQRDGVEPASCGIIGKEEQGRGDQEFGAALDQTSREDPGEQVHGAAGDGSREEALTVFGEMSYGGESAEEGLDGGEQKGCPGAGNGDSPGTKRSLNGKGGSEAAGDIAKDLL
ncbi:MAG TPA: IS3 family transposase [Thermodesulfobacteriota bacterium]|nr:IS3 family transposase [Thermodesulfobacteriota bacterium]